MTRTTILHLTFTVLLFVHTSSRAEKNPGIKEDKSDTMHPRPIATGNSITQGAQSLTSSPLGISTTGTEVIEDTGIAEEDSVDPSLGPGATIITTQDQEDEGEDPVPDGTVGDIPAGASGPGMNTSAGMTLGSAGNSTTVPGNNITLAQKGSLAESGEEEVLTGLPSQAAPTFEPGPDPFTAKAGGTVRAPLADNSAAQTPGWRPPAQDGSRSNGALSHAMAGMAVVVAVAVASAITG
jgi:hypothetical protein